MPKSPTEKVSCVVVLHKVQEIIAARTTSPAEDLKNLGRALLEIGEAIDDMSPAEAVAILEAAFRLSGFKT